MKRKKITRHIKNWRIGDYFRQFSIVVAGIIVTFYGSDLIAEHARQKEVESVMQFVRSELEHNKEELQNIQNTLAKEQQICFYLIDCHFEIRQIPADTLQKYHSLLFTTYSFEYTSDALEVLKNSSLMQKINDKKLLLDLVKTYDALHQLKETIASLYNKKEDILISISFSWNKKDREKLNECDIYTKYEIMLENTRMQNFCYLGVNNFESIFPHTLQLLNDNIKALSEKYPSK